MTTIKIGYKFGGLVLAGLAGAGLGRGAPAGVGAATPEGCRALRLHGKKVEATACFEALARSGNAYEMAEGYWGLEDYEQAKKEFEVAIAQPKSPALWLVQYVMLFHERFNNTHAADLFNEALGQDPRNAQAYLGLAMLSADGFDEKAAEDRSE